MLERRDKELKAIQEQMTHMLETGDAKEMALMQKVMRTRTITLTPNSKLPAIEQVSTSCP